MIVRNVMKVNVATCGPDTNLAAAAAKMWERDCGALAVVDELGHVVGIITDRDVCIAVGTRPRPAAEIAVREVMARDVAVCSPVDDVNEAAATMRRHRVRRLPVVDHRGVLVGLLTLDDIARRAAGPSDVAVSPGEVVALMRAIRAHHDAEDEPVH